MDGRKYCNVIIENIDRKFQSATLRGMQRETCLQNKPNDLVEVSRVKLLTTVHLSPQHPILAKWWLLKEEYREACARKARPDMARGVTLFNNKETPKRTQFINAVCHCVICGKLVLNCYCGKELPLPPKWRRLKPTFITKKKKDTQAFSSCKSSQSLNCCNQESWLYKAGRYRFIGCCTDENKNDKSLQLPAFKTRRD